MEALRRARLPGGRTLAGTLLALAIVLGVVPATVDAAAFSASASLEPTPQYLGDSAGTLLTFTVNNTGVTHNIAAVQIRRPFASWSVVGCPDAPAGWTSQRLDARCRYFSAPGAADDIAPGESVEFGLRATTVAAGAGFSGAWSVVVSRVRHFADPAKQRAASATGEGLTHHVFAFEVTAAVVRGMPKTPGTLCPPANSDAVAGSSGHTIVICGRNHSTVTITPRLAYSELGGSFIAAHGGFASGPIAPSMTSRVLGNWSNVTITSDEGADHDVIARIGRVPGRRSPLTTLTGFSAFVPNEAPVADEQGPLATDEDTPLPITLSGSDADADPLTFSIVDSPSMGSLGAIGTPDCSTTPGTCTADVTYTPSADQSGPDSFTFKVNDGTVDSAPATVSITVNAINDPPTASNLSAAETYTEDAPLNLTDIVVGDVEGDTLTVTLTLSDTAAGSLNTATAGGTTSTFAAGVWSATGPASELNTLLAGLTFSPASNFSADFSIGTSVSDGIAPAVTGTKAMTGTPINDAPVNTVPAAATVDEDTQLAFTGGDAISIADVDAGSGDMEVQLSVTNGTLTMSTTTGLTFTSGANGTDEMTFTGTLSNVNAALGTLSFMPTQDFPGTALSGTAAFQIVSDDQGNTGSPGALTDTDSFDITVNQVNDAPDPADHTLTTSSSIRITIGSSDSGRLKDGATDVDDASAALTVDASFTDVDPGATVALTDAATGTYTYNPAAGFTGTDVFSYQVCDDGAPVAPVMCGTGTVTVTVNGVDLWFVDDSAAPGGTGRLTDPFDSLADLAGGRGNGDRIFVYSGNHADGHTLLSGEHLIGQGATGSGFDTLLGVNVPGNGTLDARPSVGGARPVLANTVTLATNGKLQGLDVSSAGNTALSGSGATGVDVSQTALTTTTGTALQLTNVGGTITLTDLDKNGDGTGISLANVAATLTIPAGASIASTTVAGVDIDQGTGSISYAGTIFNSSGRTVEVTNRNTGSPGLVQFTGSVGSAGGTGVNLDNNDNGTVTFSGGLWLSTGTSNAFTAVNGGTVNVTGSTNTLTTTTGTALKVDNANIGASGLTFQSINVDGSDAAPTNGIVLNSTGSAGGLTITGIGSTPGSGGTIQDASGDGISLVATHSPSLAFMTITSNLGNGIKGGNNTPAGVVTNATLANLTLSNNGNDSGTEDGIFFNGLVGTATWTNLDVSGSARDNARVHNTSGTLTSLTISGSHFHDNLPNGSSNGLALIADGTSTMTVNVGTTNFTKNRVTGVLGQTSSAGTLTLDVQGGSYANNFIGVEFAHASTGSLTGTFNDGDITNTGDCSGSASPCGAPVNIFLGSQSGSDPASILRATITDNDIDNGGSENAPGIWIHTGTPVRGHVRALITGNTITDIGHRGIDVTGGGCDVGQTCDATIDATIENNTVDLTAPASLEAIVLTGATNVADTITFCVDIENNTASSAGHDGIRVRQRQNSTVRLPGYGGTAFDTAAVVLYLDGRNSGTTDTITAVGNNPNGGGFVNGTCSTP